MILLAACLAGLEAVVVEDLQSFLTDQPSATVTVLSSQTIRTGESACGLIMVEVEKVPAFIHRVRSVQFWMIQLLHVPQASMALDAAMEQITTQLANVSVLDAYKHWTDCLDSSPADRIRFCVRCVRDGEHSFTSVDLAKRIGEVIYQQTHWEVSMKEMDVEVLCIASPSLLVLGLLLPIGCKPAMKSKLPSEMRPPVLSASIAPSLRPSTAYLMVKLAQPQPHELLLDGMCGSGAIFVEAAYGHQCIALGGDADSKLSQNLLSTMGLAQQMSNSKTITEALIWSCKHLPVRDGAVDIAVIDLPFSKLGNTVPNYQRPRPGQTVTELARVLVPGTGRCVLLTQTHQQLANCLNSVYFEDCKVYPVNIGGYVASILTARRTAVMYVRQEVLQHIDKDKDQQQQQQQQRARKRPASDITN